MRARLWLQVLDQIEGVNGQQLPWEGAALTPERRTMLGIFRSILLRLLHRDAQQRPSMQEFCTACDRVLASGTTADANAKARDAEAPGPVRGRGRLVS